MDMVDGDYSWFCAMFSDLYYGTKRFQISEELIQVIKYCLITSDLYINTKKINEEWWWRCANAFVRKHKQIYIHLLKMITKYKEFTWLSQGRTRSTTSELEINNTTYALCTVCQEKNAFVCEHIFYFECRMNEEWGDPRGVGSTSRVAPNNKE